MKKTFSTILSLIAVLTLIISGCSNEAANEKEVGSEVTSLVYVASQDNFNPAEDYTRKLIKDLLGYNIIPKMGNDEDKVNLILSSGEKVDAINLDNRNLLGTYIKNGAIQPLNDHIDKHGPNLKKAFSQDVWDLVSKDGKIYALPTTNYTAVTEGVMIRKDWLDKLGLDVPTTPEEFYNVLKAFKEKDPGGVGKDKVIPFTFNAENYGQMNLNGLAQAFGIGNGPSEFIEDNSKIVSGFEKSGGKEYISYLNKLYQEGLLDQDLPANKADNVQQKIASGVVGAAFLSAWDSPTIDALVSNVPDAEMVFLEPFKAKDGSQKMINTGGLYSFVIVPRASEKAAEVVKFANAFLDPKNYTKLILGEEGKSYEVKEGKYFPIFPEFDKFNKGRWFYPVNESSIYTPLFGARARKEEMMGNMYDDINEKGLQHSYTPVMKNAPLLPAEEKYGQQLQVLAQENLLKMVIDENELSNYDQFVSQWKEQGGEELTNELNNWYAETK